jgi:hypothetical protein
MTRKLSHSSVSTYQTCPKKWELHYNERLRPKRQSSALLFGTALDKSFEAMTQGEDGFAFFEKVWSFQIINNETVYLPDSELLAYYKSDLELFLLSNEDKEKLNLWLKENTPETRNWDEVFYELSEERDIQGFDNLKIGKQRFLNLVFWYSLRAKGLLMIQTLKDKVLPKITKILSTQEEINISLGNGDKITGFTDLVAKWNPHEDDYVIFDLKTSSNPYEADSVLKSPQLALYVHALKDKYQTRKCGFIVLGKKIIKNKTKLCSVCKIEGTGSKARTCDKEIDKKRCGGAWEEAYSPEIMLQIIVDTIPEAQEKLVLENFTAINNVLKSGVFIRNFQSCVMPYGKCAFYNYCHNNNGDDLIKLEEKV